MAAVILPRRPDMDATVQMMQQDARFELEGPADISAQTLGRIVEGNRAPQALAKVPKVFISNNCQFNCAYCACRSGNEGYTRYFCAPKELAQLCVKQALANRHGIFISTAIHKNADYTQEMMVETLRIIRRELGYKGYVHAKVMPGADPELIRRTGLLASRMSVNIEVAHSSGYAKVAKNKTRANILDPMGQISSMIARARAEGLKFATTQTTQMMAGSMGEDDRTILELSAALYKTYRLSRVYYTAFHYEGQARGYDLQPVRTPPWRMNRLYQADRLMQLYGFDAGEIAPEGERLLAPDLDPKAAWALRNMHMFPVEVNTADFEQLIRVPGIGLVYAKRIVEARKYAHLSFETLRRLGVPFKRARYFITCGGKFMGNFGDDTGRIRMLLARQPGEGAQ